MAYVDGMICAVPTANRETYREHAARAAQAFKKHGAQSVVECWGVDVPEGKLNSMHTAVMRKEDETVVFSWIMWPSKAMRDEAMPKVMAEPEMCPSPEGMPFDGQRLVFGGFETIVEA